MSCLIFDDAADVYRPTYTYKYFINFSMLYIVHAIHLIGYSTIFSTSLQTTRVSNIYLFHLSFMSFNISMLCRVYIYSNIPKLLTP